MSKRINVNPGHYKTAGRERQGDDVVHELERQRLSVQAEEQRLSAQAEDQRHATEAKPNAGRKDEEAEARRGAGFTPAERRGGSRGERRSTPLLNEDQERPARRGKAT